MKLSNIFAYSFLVYFNLSNEMVFAHGALAEGGSEGGGPLIFIPVIITFGIFLVFANRRKGWNILVVGGAGYLGSILVSRLLAHGHRITVFDSYAYGEKTLEAVRANLDLKEVKGDIRSAQSLESALTECNAVIYVMDERMLSLDTMESEQTLSNYLQTFRAFIKKASAIGIKRIIFTSSLSIFGSSKEREIIESTSLQPSTLLAKCKAVSEKIVEEECLSNVTFSIIRLPSILGPGTSAYIEGELNQIVNNAIKNNYLLINSGFTAYPYIHVEDLVDFYLFLLDQSDNRINNQRYNVGYGQIADTEFAEIVKSQLDQNMSININTKRDIEMRFFSFEKVTKELGFIPKRDLRIAVRDLICASKVK